jgi:hypothetical protein
MERLGRLPRRDLGARELSQGMPSRQRDQWTVIPAKEQPTVVGEWSIMSLGGGTSGLVSESRCACASRNQPCRRERRI